MTAAHPTLPDDQQPHEVRVDSRDAVTSKDEDETFLGGLPMHKHAEANPTPFGKAVTTTAPFGVAGVLEIGGGTATSTSGLVEGGAREAKAVTDISGIRLVGGVGLIELSGLHWEAIWSSRTNGVTGSFSIANAKVAGRAASHQRPECASRQRSTPRSPPPASSSRSRSPISPAACCSSIRSASPWSPVPA